MVPLTFATPAGQSARVLRMPLPATCGDDGCIAELERQAAEREQAAAAADAAAAAELAALRWRAVVPPRHHSARVEHVRPDLAAWHPGLSLYLAGSIGSGKTHQVAALLRRAALTGGVAWWDVRELVAAAQASAGKRGKRPAVMDSPAAPDVVVLDDIAAARNTDFGVGVVADIIAARYNAMRPVVVTSNLTMDELARFGTGQMVDPFAWERVVDRLAEMTAPGAGMRVWMTGDSWRTRA